MADTATIQSVPRKRGELTTKQAMRLEFLRIAMEDAQSDYRIGVIHALAQGASFSEVSRATGLSTNTLQRWKREAAE